MVAALGDLQVRVMPRRELHPLRRHEIDVRVVRFGQMLVNRGHHAVGVLRPSDREHRGMHLGDDALLRAQAAGDDHFAVLGERFADGLQRFLHRGVDEAAGVDDHEVGVVVRGRGDVALGAQLREDALGIDQRFRTAQGNKPDLGDGATRRNFRTCRARSCLCLCCQTGNRGRKGPRTCCGPGSASDPGTARTPSGSARCRPASGSASPAPAGS